MCYLRLISDYFGWVVLIWGQSSSLFPWGQTSDLSVFLRTYGYECLCLRRAGVDRNFHLHFLGILSPLLGWLHSEKIMMWFTHHQSCLVHQNPSSFLLQGILFWDRVLLCVPGWPEIHNVNQLFSHRDPPASAPGAVGSKSCTTTPGLLLQAFKKLDF